MILPRLASVTILLSISFLFVTGCGGKKHGDTANQDFLVEPFEDGYRLSIKDSALNKPFLLSPGYSEARPSLLPWMLDTQIVRFERRGSNLAMVQDESMARMQRAGVASTELLAEFPIDDNRSSGGVYYIDFNSGMRDFVASLVLAGIIPGEELGATHIDRAVMQNDVLFVDQAVDLSAPKDATPAGQVHYTLQPYQAAAGFAPLDGVEVLGQHRAGFFMNPPIYQNDSPASYQYATRWDLTKPLVWSISANTPPDVKAAVRDGILYWNKVLGKDVIQVDDAPVDALPNDPGRNIVQWINNDTVTFAYAQFRADPLTGQMLQAFVALPSSWYLAGVDSFAQSIAALQARPQSLKTAKSAAKSTPVCALAPDSTQLKTMFSQLLQDGGDDAVKRSSLDLIRSVVAHEIGHTMGLRHNFTAKTQLDGNAASYQTTIDTYLKTGNAAAKVFLSSVMDYSPLVLDAAVGSEIRTATFVGKYDAAALGWAYAGTATGDVDGGLFCTDEETTLNVNVECQRFIEPGSPGDAALTALGRLGKRAAMTLAANFLAGKAPLSGPPLAAQYIALDPESDAVNLTANDTVVLNDVLFDAEGSPNIFLQTQRGYKVLDPLNHEDFVKAQSAYQVQLIAAMGGIKAVFAPFVPKARADGRVTSDAMEDAEASFEHLITQPTYRDGTSATKVLFTFSDDEISYMKSVGPKYFRKVEAAALKEIIKALLNANYVPGREIGTALITYPPAVSETDLGQGLADLATAVVNAEDSERLTATIGTVKIDVAKPYFDLDLRQRALQLFSHDLYDAGGKTFNKGASAALDTALKARQDELVGHDATLLEKLPSDVFKEWGYVSTLITKLESIDGT